MEEGKMIVSRENIKPSSPTPHHKRIHKLSLLDQIAEPIYVSLVSYYPNLDQDNTTNQNADDQSFISETVQTLKQSLSATLTSFYPLAGRILTKESLSIDCNDQGVRFVVVRFDYSLSDFLKKPDPQACRGHLPSQLVWLEPGPETHLAMVQVNLFGCGGIAIGSVFLHRAVDGVSIAVFMRAWATAAARGSGAEPVVAVFPDYVPQSLFPNNESLEKVEPNFLSATLKLMKLGKHVLKRYVFDASAISKLKSQLMLSSGRPPSRVEVVTAFIWKCFMIAAARKSSSTDDDDDDDDDDDHSVSVVTHGINLRRKADPPFPEQSFGNFVWSASASTSNSTNGRDLKHLLTQVRSAIDKVDADYLKRMQGDGEGFSGYCKNLEQALDYPADAEDVLLMTSWCNLGLYDVDFGWGKPMWVSRCDPVSTDDTESEFLNMVLLMDTREGDGIEASLTLDKHLFDEFDKIEELRDLASLDPSPFKIDPKY